MRRALVTDGYDRMETSLLSDGEMGGRLFVV